MREHRSRSRHRHHGVALLGASFIAIGSVLGLFAFHDNSEAARVRAHGHTISGRVLEMNVGRKGGGEMPLPMSPTGLPTPPPSPLHRVAATWLVPRYRWSMRTISLTRSLSLMTATPTGRATAAQPRLLSSGCCAY